MSKDYIRRLHLVLAVYVLGFACLFVGLSFIEQLGVSNTIVGNLFIFLPLLGYIIVSFTSRPSHLSDFYVAGRQIPAFYNGMASGAAWMSAASFVGMSGTLYLLGHDGLVFILGWTAGFVLMAILVVPYFRRSGAISAPEFLGNRYDSKFVRALAVVLVFSTSAAYLIAQLYACGIIMQNLLGWRFANGILIGAAITLFCTIIGGMRSVTWTQVAQCIVFLIAFMVPLTILAVKHTGIPFPWFAYGQALVEIGDLERSIVAKGLASGNSLKPHIQPLTAYDSLNFYCLSFSLMLGSAVIPHLLTRYVSTPSVSEARYSVFWTLLFVSILYLAAPAYAAFVKLEVYSLIANGTKLTDLPGWMMQYGAINLVHICGVAASSTEAVVEACTKIANHPGLLRISDLSLNPDVIVMSVPYITGMPYVIVSLLAAGGLAAAISTTTALLMTLSTVLSHDIYYGLINRNARPNRRLLLSRIVIGLVVAVATIVALDRPPDILAMVAWAFSLSASGLFAALVLGIWWKRTTTLGAALGMLAGFGMCLYYLIGTRYYAVTFYETWSWLSIASDTQAARFLELKKAWMSASPSDSWAAWRNLDRHAQTIAPWFGIRTIAAAVFGVPIAIATTVAVSLLTGRPSAASEAFVERLRSPDIEHMQHDDGT